MRIIYKYIYIYIYTNPMDQVLECFFKIIDFTMKQYKQGIFKRKMIEQLKTQNLYLKIDFFLITFY